MRLPLLISLFSLFIFSSSAFSQNKYENWFQMHADEAVKIEYKFEKCLQPEKGLHNEYVLLKVTNLSNEAIELSYDQNLWYNGQETASETGNNYAIKLAAGETKTGSCADDSKALKIYSKILDLEAKSKLSNFKVSNVQVAKN